MPWNDQKGGGSSGGGGPWGGGGPGGGSGGGNGGGDSPWSRGTGGKGGRPGGDRPDLEETLRRMQDRFRRRGDGGGGGNNGSGRGGRGFGATGLVILLAVAVVGWLFTGIYQVNEQESAVVLRFGKFHRTEAPGFRIRLPNPIESHIVVPVNRINETRIGDDPEESLMLTGDENIVNIDFSINWRIAAPQDYLFNVVDVVGSGNSARNELIQQIGESSMREVVGTSAFEPITTGDRTGVESRVRDLMQSTLNSYRAGVEIMSISLREATAPPEVVDVQRDVSNAEQDRARRQAEANAYRNRVVPEARGEAQAVIQAAQAYRESSVANAQGEANRFNLIYDEYRQAPRVTRERMFLETMERILARTDQIILDSETGAVPILPLDMLRGRQQPSQ